MTTAWEYCQHCDGKGYTIEEAKDFGFIARACICAETPNGDRPFDFVDKKWADKKLHDSNCSDS